MGTTNQQNIERLETRDVMQHINDFKQEILCLNIERLETRDIMQNIK